MTRPQTFLVRMALFLVAVAIVVGLLIAPLIEIFGHNPALNGVILAALAIGILYALRQVMMLVPEVEWLNKFRRSEPGLSALKAPQLLAPVAAMLADRQEQSALAPTALRALLDSLSSRLDESREISRYFTGLLIFLGLLGTFWGLLETVSAVGSTIGNLTITSGDFNQMFSQLQAGLTAPLAGMGTAFGSSLFGLTGSLVLGFLDLQAGQAQNRFYNDLEEWLSGMTKVTAGRGIGGVEGDQSVPAYLQALLEQTAESLANLQRIMIRSEERAASAAGSIGALNERLATLTDQMRTEQDLLVKLVEGQLALRPVLQRLSDASERMENAGLDAAARTHLRNLDLHLARLVEDTAGGREALMGEIRSEIKLLARTIAALGEGLRRPPGG
ncbi:MAG: flagellar motor protein MotA [Alphaproteobacteria bacterium]|nr:flagellar motor protein MotA [Alphaproteobacteria bacterium]